MPKHLRRKAKHRRGSSVDSADKADRGIRSSLPTAQARKKPGKKSRVNSMQRAMLREM